MGCFKLLVVMEKMCGGATLGNLLPALTHIFIASQEKLWQGRWQRENSAPARNTTHSNEWLAVICQTVQRVLQRVVSLFYEAASSYGDWKTFSSNEQYMPELQTKKNTLTARPGLMDTPPLPPRCVTICAVKCSFRVILFYFFGGKSQKVHHRKTIRIFPRSTELENCRPSPSASEVGPMWMEMWCFTLYYLFTRLSEREREMKEKAHATFKFRNPALRTRRFFSLPSQEEFPPNTFL